MKLYDSIDYRLGDIIYQGQCGKCGEELEFECDFDADGSDYSATCCGLCYWATPLTYKMHIEPEED